MTEQESRLIVDRCPHVVGGMCSVCFQQHMVAVGQKIARLEKDLIEMTELAEYRMEQEKAERIHAGYRERGMEQEPAAPAEDGQND